MIMILVLIVALGKVDTSMMVMKNIFAGCKENSGKFPAAYPPTLPCNNQPTNDAIMSPATECSNKESDINISNIMLSDHTKHNLQCEGFSMKNCHPGSQVLLSLFPTKPTTDDRLQTLGGSSFQHRFHTLAFLFLRWSDGKGVSGKGNNGCLLLKFTIVSG